MAQNWGEYNRAVELLRRAVRLDPGDKDARLAFARLLVAANSKDQKLREEARSQLEVGLDIDPTYVNLRHEYASVLLLLGERAAAKAQCDRILGEEPDHAMTWMTLAQIYFLGGEFEQSCEACERGLNVAQDTPFSLGNRDRGYHLLALARWRAGRTEVALEAFAEATEENPALTVAYSDHASLLRELNRPDEATAVFREGVDQNPNDTQLRIGLARLLIRMKRYRPAQEQLSIVLALAPNNVVALSAMGYVKLQLDDVEGAMTQLRAAIAANPNYHLAHYHLGQALMRTGRRDEAIRHYETALRLQPSFKPAREALTRARNQ
jgi:tetratricopeptide (TPR) repeat protein